LALPLSWPHFSLPLVIGKLGLGAVAMERDSVFDKIKFAIGIILFIGLIVIHVWVKELPVWLFGLPAALWGVDLSAAFGRKK
jgi:hypothetical protein